MIILFSTFVSGLVAGMIEYLATPVFLAELKLHRTESLLVLYGSYCLSVLYYLLYPVLGFLADVFLGRYLAVTISTTLTTLALLLTSVTVVAFKTVDSHPGITTMAVISYIFGVVGMAGFEANVVQFGLDQLTDCKSKTLSLYLHFLVYVRQVGVTLAIFPLTLRDCDKLTAREEFNGAFQFIPLALFCIMGIPAIVFLIRKRTSFSRDLGNINPYRMVTRVVSFALKNRHPKQRRSAFYYYYGLNPGRLDFAKVHYGGPYSTEDVENVKTLVQMLGIFLAVGPVFILKVSTAFFMHQHFAQHFVHESVVQNHCHTFWPLGGSGNLGNISGSLLYPVYMFIIFVVLRSVPRILSRLLIGIIMITLCQLCLLLTEIVGHFMAAENANITLQCALANMNNNSTLGSNSLNIHWSSLLPPNLLIGLASLIVTTAVFEFISAQSPRPMTGLVFGTFFFLEGIFRLFGIVVMIPFSIGNIWKRPETSDELLTADTEYYVTSNSTRSGSNFAYVACEMWYLVVLVACGAAGIVAYIVAMCKYKYRKREETPFPQSDIEDIITREIEENTTQNLLDVASVEVNGTMERRRGPLYSAST